MLFLAVAFSAVAAVAAVGDTTKEIIFQSGRELQDIDGSVGVYASEFETSINKLWFGPWNENNGSVWHSLLRTLLLKPTASRTMTLLPYRHNNTGVTYFYGYQPTWPISEAGSDTKFRTLLRFDDLHDFIPASSSESNVTVLESDVTLTFVNTQQEAELEACFLTLPWDYDYEDNVRPK
jgi:hypothetical protein